MRRFVTIGLILAAWAFDATAGSYTVTTSNKEDTLIQAEVDARNQRRGTSLTIQDWVQDTVNDSLRPLKQGDRDREARQACRTFSALSGADQTTILTLLAGNSPC